MLPTGDIRDIVIYELIGEPLRFWPFEYPSSVASSDVMLPGRRDGWSSIAVGRTIEKGAYKGGTSIDVTDLATGRAVLLADGKGGAPIAATVANAVLLGTSVAFARTTSDASTMRRLGLDADQTLPTTAIASGALPVTIVFTNARRELSITIGAFPAQTIALDPVILGGGSLTNVATALADRDSRSAPRRADVCQRAGAGSPTNAIADRAGRAGRSRSSSRASPNDPDTLVALVFDSAHVRLTDGVISAPVVPPVITPINGKVHVTIGRCSTIEPADLHDAHQRRSGRRSRSARRSRRSRRR